MTDLSSFMDCLSITDNQRWEPEISCLTTFKLLSQIKLNKAPGSDGIPPHVIRKCASSIAPPLTHLFSLPIEFGELPSQWKLARVIPIPKRGAKSISDLRPISLLPIFAKILERIVVDSVRDRLVSIYGDTQFGFRPKSSTLQAHIKIHDYITLKMDDPQIDGILLTSLDLSKAFDRLSHASLIDGLIQSKLPSSFIKWCISFLSMRRQQVILGGCVTGKQIVVHSGVPQGSVLSPYLFAAHMRTLTPISSDCCIVKYADDIVLLHPFTKTSNIEVIFKSEVQNATIWCKDHGLELNENKTKCMVISKRPSFYKSSLQDKKVPYLKILGVTFTEKLKWGEHIESVCRKASSRLFIVRRLKEFMSKDDLFLVYKGFIQSILEYNAPLMAGLNVKYSEKLERLQKRAHRLICGRNCECDAFIPLSVRRDRCALKTFLRMQQEDHILHHLFPQFLPRTKHISLPIMNTHRRATSFIPYCSFLYNTQFSCYVNS